ncbi:MAG: hypothetical protein ACYDHM_12205 [Acidiferrobacterales bacterium]
MGTPGTRGSNTIFIPLAEEVSTVGKDVAFTAKIPGDTLKRRLTGKGKTALRPEDKSRKNA